MTVLTATTTGAGFLWEGESNGDERDQREQYTWVLGYFVGYNCV